MTRRNLAAALAYVALLIGIDRGIGLVMGSMLDRAQPQGPCATAALGGIAHRDAAVMFFGSSRANSQLDPVAFEEATGRRAYNAGCNGVSIFTTRMIEAIVLAREPTSQVFLLVLDPKDLYLDPLGESFRLAPLASEPALAPYIAMLPPLTRLKLYSWAYRYNSIGPRIAYELLRGRHGDDDGYLPLGGSMVGRTGGENHPGGIPRTVAFDQPFLAHQERFFLEFTRDAKRHGIEVVWIDAPRIRNGVEREPIEVRASLRLEELARDSGATLIELNERVRPDLARPELFKDHSHVNGRGARALTTAIAHELEALGLLSRDDARTRNAGESRT